MATRPTFALAAMFILACSAPMPPADVTGTDERPDVANTVDAIATIDSPPKDVGPSCVPACGAGERCIDGTCFAPVVDAAEVATADVRQPDASLVDEGDAIDVATSDVPRDTAADVTRRDARPNCTDADGDGFGVGAGCIGLDCDDTRADVNPFANERCDGIDQNCDGSRDTEGGTHLQTYCQTNAPFLAPTRSVNCIGPSASPPYVSTGRTSCQGCAVGEPCMCWVDGSRMWDCRLGP